jgi:hypothetical protein
MDSFGAVGKKMRNTTKKKKKKKKRKEKILGSYVLVGVSGGEIRQG